MSLSEGGGCGEGGGRRVLYTLVCLALNEGWAGAL